MDFFGRPIVPKTTGTGAGNKNKNKPASVSHKAPEKKKGGVSYRFNEGNSAAVRKPVKVGTFL